MGKVTSISLPTPSPSEIKRHHVALERETLRGDLAEFSKYATVLQPHWFKEESGEYACLKARRDLHKRVKKRLRKEQGSASEHKIAIIMAGPPGAGKSHQASKVMQEIDPGARWRKIDPDYLKDLILEESCSDHTFEDIVPPRLRDSEPDRAYPRELAALVHKESTDLAQRILSVSIVTGENLLLDRTLKTYQNAADLVALLIERSYKVFIFDMETSRTVSVDSVYNRWADGYRKAEENFRVGGTTVCREMGGRFVPPIIVKNAFTNALVSHCSKVVDALESRNSSVLCRRYWRASTTSGPVLKLSKS
ncbi:zeta toxin family protein [Streptomyces sp. NPDC046866]|uniref:zeta toxin family protein n=1 Tax=Streptomyces sp. NPDC046866 TaxID=3154921 RepID=UPI00345206D1